MGRISEVFCVFRGKEKAFKSNIVQQFAKIKSAVIDYVVIKEYTGKYREAIVQRYAAIEKFYSQLIKKK